MVLTVPFGGNQINRALGAYTGYRRSQIPIPRDQPRQFTHSTGRPFATGDNWSYARCGLIVGGQ
jgi:hypothetical protein